MIVLFLGSAALSVLHALIPNHWIPILLIAQAEKWGKWETLKRSFFIILAHLTSTILIGVFVGWTGLQLRPILSDWIKYISATIFLLMGIWLLFAHSHLHFHRRKRYGKSMFLSLMIVMFFSPCLELEAYYLPAAVYGWQAIVGVSLIYVIGTTTTVLLLVALSYSGMLALFQRKSSQINEIAHRLTGVIFVLFAIVSLMLE